MNGQVLGRRFLNSEISLLKVEVTVDANSVKIALPTAFSGGELRQRREQITPPIASKYKYTIQQGIKLGFCTFTLFFLVLQDRGITRKGDRPGAFPAYCRLYTLS